MAHGRQKTWTARTTLSACICVRWALSNCCRREGEIAIAKRIEAGRNTMIAGLCESPLTFQAITIWRDELLSEDILLRDVIDLEATFGDQMGEEGETTPVVPAAGAAPVVEKAEDAKS